MIVIAIATLVLLISYSFYEARYAKSSHVVYVTGGNKLTSRHVTAQPNVIIDNPNFVIPSKDFIGYTISQSDTIDTPRLVYPVEFENFITESLVGDTLKIGLEARQKSDKTTYIFRSSEPITLLVPEMPQSIANETRCQLNICGVKTRKTSLSGHNLTTFTNCRIDTLVIYDNDIRLTDSSTVAEIIVPNPHYVTSCEADSTSVLGSVFISGGADTRSTLRLNTKNGVNIRYLPSAKKTLDIDI